MAGKGDFRRRHASKKDNITYQSFRTNLNWGFWHSRASLLSWPTAMPAQPSWHHRVPQILAILSDPACPPFFDRPAIETLFGLRRRQAIRILTACGGYQVGKTFLAGRETLLGFVSGVEQSGAVEVASLRRRRLSAALNEAANHTAARMTRIAAPPDKLAADRCGLSPAIELVAPGTLIIRYQGATDLLARIAELAAAATSDFPRFRKLVEEA
jgi:hypothetical protein